jgi:bifunctional non-homologous end joining protein LigD
VQVWRRRGPDFTHRFPAIAEAVRSLACDSALVDREAVALRKDGRSEFVAHLTKCAGAQASFVAFDLMRLNGDDLRLRPLEARRRRSCVWSPASNGTHPWSSWCVSWAAKTDRKLPDDPIRDGVRNAGSP